jgi:hypothetical protein
LFRLARFIDKTNLTEFFESPVLNEPQLTSSSSIISKVYYGRLKASAYFFRLKEAKSNRKLWDAVKSISDTHRNFISHNLAVESLKRELESAEKKVLEIGNNLDDQISKCAFTYTRIENPAIRPEMIINGSDNVTKEMREATMMNCRM